MKSKFEKFKLGVLFKRVLALSLLLVGGVFGIGQKILLTAHRVTYFERSAVLEDNRRTDKALSLLTNSFGLKSVSADISGGGGCSGCSSDGGGCGCCGCDGGGGGCCGCGGG